MTEGLNFPADFAADPAPTGATKILSEGGYLTPDMLAELLAAGASPLAEAVSSGELFGVSQISAHGGFDKTALLTIVTGPYYVGVDVQTKPSVHLIWAAASFGLVPFGYPSSSQSINGSSDIYPVSPGLSILVGDGANVWGVIRSSLDPKNDFSKANGPPGTSDDDTQGWGVGSIIVDNTSAVWVCTSTVTSSAEWLPLGGGGGSEEPFEWNGVDDEQFSLSQTPPSPRGGISSGMADASLVVEADGTMPSRNRFKVTASSSAPLGIAFWFIDDLIEPVDQTIDWWTKISGVAGGDSWGIGLAFLADADEQTFMMYVTGYDASGSAETQLRTSDGGVRVGTGDPFAHVTIKLACHKDPGSKPGFWFDLEHAQDNGTPRWVMDFAAVDLAQPITSAWHPSACNRVAIVLFSREGATGGCEATITGLRVRSGVQ